jgi:hypothetical protein
MTRNISGLGVGEHIAYLREALELQVIAVSDVVHWADRQIGR